MRDVRDMRDFVFAFFTIRSPGSRQKMVIPEGCVGFCLAIGVFDTDGAEELAYWVIGEPGFFRVKIKRMVHLIPLLPDEACIRNKTSASL